MSSPAYKSVTVCPRIPTPYVDCDQLMICLSTLSKSRNYRDLRVRCMQSIPTPNRIIPMQRLHLIPIFPIYAIHDSAASSAVTIKPCCNSPHAAPSLLSAFAVNAGTPGFIAPTFGGKTSKLPSFLFQKSTSTIAVLAGWSSWMKCPASGKTWSWYFPVIPKISTTPRYTGRQLMRDK